LYEAFDEWLAGECPLGVQIGLFASVLGICGPDQIVIAAIRRKFSAAQEPVLNFVCEA
jgi:hypothetical protein